MDFLGDIKVTLNWMVKRKTDKHCNREEEIAFVSFGTAYIIGNTWNLEASRYKTISKIAEFAFDYCNLCISLLYRSLLLNLVVRSCSV